MQAGRLAVETRAVVGFQQVERGVRLGIQPQAGAVLDEESAFLR